MCIRARWHPPLAGAYDGFTTWPRSRTWTLFCPPGRTLAGWGRRPKALPLRPPRRTSVNDDRAQWRFPPLVARSRP
eukprot:4456584-Pyramimonas_sp.AAC.1